MPNGYDVGWIETAYEGSSGNFPLWESELLRPVFRSVFRDWQNGDLNFPALGDATSNDPNQAGGPKAYVDPAGIYVTPFTPQPSLPVAAPGTALALVISGVQSLTYAGTTFLASLVGDGLPGDDSVTITVTTVTTGETTLAVEWWPTGSFTRASGSFLADGFEVGDEIVASGFSLNNGVFHVTSVSALALGVAEPLMFGDTSGSGNEKIVSIGRLVFAGAGPFGAGLTALTVVADEIVVQPGVTINIPGALSFSADTITIGSQAHVVAVGNVTFTADKAGGTEFVGLHIVGPEAFVDMGPGATVTGANIDLSATASMVNPTNESAHLSNVITDLLGVLPAAVGAFAALALIVAHLDFVPAEVQSGVQTVADTLEAAEKVVRDLIGDDEVFKLPDGIAANAVFGKADARVDVHNGGRITGTGTVGLLAHAISTVIVTTEAASGYLGLSYASSVPTAQVRLFPGAWIDADGDVTLTSSTETTLTMRTEVRSDADGLAISASFGKTEALARTSVATGVRIDAPNLALSATNTRTIDHVVTAAGFADSDDAGNGATLAVGQYVANATAVLAGLVNVTGNVTVNAASSETKNDTQAFGSVSGQPDGSKTNISQTTEDAIKGLGLDQNVGGQSVSPTSSGGSGGGLAIGAAIALVEAENTAAAFLDEGA